MIKKSISRTTFQTHLIDFVRDEMYEEAIKDDGIYSTFKFHNRCFETGEIRITLQYYRLFDGGGCSWTIVKKYIFYKTCPELDGTWLTFPGICPETLQRVADRIKMDMVKKDNAIWSTIRVQPCRDHFDVSYKKAYVDSTSTPNYIKWKPVFDDRVVSELQNKVYSELGIKETDKPEPMTAQEMEIENTKKTLRRLEWLNRNAIYGLYPRNAGTTYAFDEKAREILADITGKTVNDTTNSLTERLIFGKEDLKASLKTWKAKADLDIHSPSKELLNRVYGSHTKEEKEKKDMNVTLLVVPEGMSKDFVRKVKANFQSNNSLRLFIASTDIDYSCEHEPIKTKYDLFEKWIKTGYVDVVYFMLGFEKDPDVKAFESFVRGITEFSNNNKVDIHVVYQKDDIENDIQHLRTAYFDEADAKEDLENAGNKVVKEAKILKEVYSLNNTGLDIIKYSKGKIDASDELVINDIMDTAFASDEDTKPAKKGGKK